MTQIKDLYDPPELTSSGDFRSTEGASRVMNKALRVLFMRKGELLHRPDLGGDLTLHASRPPTDDNLNRAANAAKAALNSIAEIDSHKVELRQGDKANVLFFDLTISVAGQSLTRRDIRVEG